MVEQYSIAFPSTPGDKFVKAFIFLLAKMFGGLEALQEILGVVHRRTSQKAKGKGKGGGPRTYEIQNAEEVSLWHYEHPRVLDFPQDSNAGAKLSLFNSKALGDVAYSHNPQRKAFGM